MFDKAEEFFKVSRVDLLANNAGVNTNLGWRKCMAINIISVMLGSEIAQERMRKAGKAGQVINTASMAGFAPGINEEMTPYTVSKHGVVALTRTMGKANTGVLHKCICPAWTETKLVLSAMEVDRKDDMSEHIKKSGGFMTPEHVAEGFYRLVTQCENGSALAVMKVLYSSTLVRYLTISQGCPLHAHTRLQPHPHHSLCPPVQAGVEDPPASSCDWKPSPGLFQPPPDGLLLLDNPHLLIPNESNYSDPDL